MSANQFGYTSEHQYAQPQGLRKASNATHDAQVASEQAAYNRAVEQSMSNKISSLHITPAAPSTIYQEQRSRSVDEGSSREVIHNSDFTRTAQDDALSKLTGELERAQQQMVQARIEEESVRQSPPAGSLSAQELEIQRRVDLALRHHIAFQTAVASSPIHSTHHGIPSSPRPDLHQRNPSHSERKPSSASQSRNGSVDHSKPNGFFSGAARKVSLALHGRNQSVDETGSPARAHVAPFQTPRSASNAGLKTVKVICDQVALNIPIVPTTTAIEILNMAGAQLGEGFDQKRYVLVESFTEVGSERPLRYYERIRDVLNSWDNDEQNMLLIQPFNAHWEYESLDLLNAPIIIPSDLSTSLYYSHRPESWHKYTFTLKADGSVVMQKYKGGEAKAICNMTDFDIYVPTHRQLKKLAPPRRFCFAIKSQQKSVLFENASNFVHFFCTSEQSIASEWYRALHGWRSHHLVHAMGISPGTAPLSIRPSVSDTSYRNPSIAHSSQRKASEASSYFPQSQPAYTSQHTALDMRGGAPTAYSRAIASNYSRSGSVASSNQGSSRNGSVDSSATEHSLTENVPARKESLFTLPVSQSTQQSPSNIHPLHRTPQAEQSPFSGYAVSGQDYALRKDLTSSQHDIAPFAHSNPATQDYPVRKQSSASDLNKVIPHAPSWRKPSTVSVQEEESIGPTQDAHSGYQTPIVPPTGTASPFEWRFDPFTGQALGPAEPPSHSNTMAHSSSTSSSTMRKDSRDDRERKQSLWDRKGSSASYTSYGGRKDSSASYGRKDSSASYSRKGSSASAFSPAARKGSRDDRKHGAKARKASAVKLHTSEHLCAW